MRDASVVAQKQLPASPSAPGAGQPARSEQDAHALHAYTRVCLMIVLYGRLRGGRLWSAIDARQLSADSVIFLSYEKGAALRARRDREGRN
jgi:hypothetical protein